jgi:ABC-type oligopeptide transport system ATPase subunit
LIVLDEPVSALDVSIRAQIMTLLEDLQRELGVAYLFMGHDLATVTHISDRIAVMYLGKIVEQASAPELVEKPPAPVDASALRGRTPSRARGSDAGRRRQWERAKCAEPAVGLRVTHGVRSRCRNAPTNDPN